MTHFVYGNSGVRATRSWLAAAALLAGLSASAQAEVYVYELPGGTRIVTDHRLNNPSYRLVRQQQNVKDMGALLSRRLSNSVWVDPSYYDRLIARTAAAHNVDPALVKAMMHVESGFDPHAVSPKGASGLMQLMPATASRFGVSDIFDPKQNVQGGVRYLKYLLAKFDNNSRLVIAAYNAGENAVLRYKGVPPYNETQAYVVKVMALRKQYTKKTEAITVADNSAGPRG